jgi:drug/metabolite transporter (DMT)-like permease
MAQTKRKRRSKHRGNAAGVVETRGRTGRRPTADEQKKASREQRLSKPPTWNSAFLKAGLMAGLLFVFTRLGVFGSNTTVAQSVILCFFALLLYTPIAYATDRFVYTRAQKRKQSG